jgi:hypothetical protein
MPEEKPKENRKVKVIYEDEDGQVREKVMPFGDYYDERVSYRDNMQALVEEVLDEGGFWRDAETIIPSHRIRAFKTVRQNRRPRRKATRKKVAKPKSPEKEA